MFPSAICFDTQLPELVSYEETQLSDLKSLLLSFWRGTYKIALTIDKQQKDEFLSLVIRIREICLRGPRFGLIRLLLFLFVLIYVHIIIPRSSFPFLFRF